MLLGLQVVELQLVVKRPSGIANQVILHDRLLFRLPMRAAHEEQHA